MPQLFLYYCQCLLLFIFRQYWIDKYFCCIIIKLVTDDLHFHISFHYSFDCVMCQEILSLLINRHMYCVCFENVKPKLFLISGFCSLSSKHGRRWRPKHGRHQWKSSNRRQLSCTPDSPHVSIWKAGCTGVYSLCLCKQLHVMKRLFVIFNWCQ